MVDVNSSGILDLLFANANLCKKKPDLDPSLKRNHNSDSTGVILVNKIMLHKRF